MTLFAELPDADDPAEAERRARWLALRAAAPMRQPARMANAARQRAEQDAVDGLALFDAARSPPLL